MPNRISEMYLLEREQWLSEVLQKHQSSVIIHMHSFCDSETDKNVHSMYCGFHTKRGRPDLQFFQRRRIQRFIFEILRVISLLEEKFIFKSLGTREFFRIFWLSVCVHVFPVVNFLEQFQLYFYFKYLRIRKLYNLGNKRFETVFSKYTQQFTLIRQLDKTKLSPTLKSSFNNYAT